MTQTNIRSGVFGRETLALRTRLEVAWHVLKGRPAMYRIWFADPPEIYEHPDLLGTKLRGVSIGAEHEPDVIPGDVSRLEPIPRPRG